MKTRILLSLFISINILLSINTNAQGPEVTISTESLALGEIPLESCYFADNQIIVTNTGDGYFIINNFTFNDGDSFSLASTITQDDLPYHVYPDTEVLFNVEFDGFELGLQNASLSIQTSEGDFLIPISAEVYQPIEADVFNLAQTINIQNGSAIIEQITVTPELFKKNYFVEDENIKTDLVYKINTTEDLKFDIFCAIDNDVNAQLTVVSKDYMCTPSFTNILAEGVNSIVDIPLYHDYCYLFVGLTDENATLNMNINAEAMAVPGEVVLNSPVDEAIDLNWNGVSLDWEAAEFATSYSLYFGTTENPSLYTTGLLGTEFIIEMALFPNKTYYWTVVAHNLNGSTSSEIFSFTTVAEAVNISADPETIDFGFAPNSFVHCESSLEITLSNDDTSEIIISDIYIEGDNSPDSQYSIDVTGLPMVLQFGETFLFDIDFQPTVIGEANDRIIIVSNQGIKEIPITASVYDASEGDIIEVAKEYSLVQNENINDNFSVLATEYKNNYFLDNDDVTLDYVFKFDVFSDMIVDFNITGDDDVYVNLLLYEGVYGCCDINSETLVAEGIENINANLFPGTYYLITTIDAESSNLNVEIQPGSMPAPNTPVLLTPEDGAINQTCNGLILDWDEVDNAYTYKLFLGSTNPPQLYSEGETLTEETLGELAGGYTYYWRVEAVNANGSTTSEIYSFTTIADQVENLTVVEQTYGLELQYEFALDTDSDEEILFNIYVDNQLHSQTTELMTVIDDITPNMTHNICVSAIVNGAETEKSCEEDVFYAGVVTVIGNVYNVDGAAIENAVVEFTGVDYSVSRYTDADGFYEVLLPVVGGPYIATVTALGWCGLTQDVVTDNEINQLDFNLPECYVVYGIIVDVWGNAITEFNANLTDVNGDNPILPYIEGNYFRFEFDEEPIIQQILQISSGGFETYIDTLTVEGYTNLDMISLYPISPIISVEAVVLDDDNGCEITINVMEDYSYSPITYNVYLLNATDVNNWGAWASIATSIGETEYIDNVVWPSIAEGEYRYAIQSIVNDVALPPSFSNVVNNYSSFNLTGSIITESKQELPNAFIEVLNEANNYSNSVFANEDGTYALEVSQFDSEYILNITAPGFSTTTNTFMYTGEDVIIDVVLDPLSVSMASLNAVQINYDEVKLSFEATNSELISVYYIFQNDVLIQTVDADVNTFTISDLGNGNYEYCVSAQHADGITSQLCSDEIVITNTYFIQGYTRRVDNNEIIPNVLVELNCTDGIYSTTTYSDALGYYEFEISNLESDVALLAMSTYGNSGNYIVEQGYNTIVEQDLLLGPNFELTIHVSSPESSTEGSEVRVFNLDTDMPYYVEFVNENEYVIFHSPLLAYSSNGYRVEVWSDFCPMFEDSFICDSDDIEKDVVICGEYEAVQEVVVSQEEGNADVIVEWVESNAIRSFVSYDVYRIPVADIDNEENWVFLDEVTSNTYADEVSNEGIIGDYVYGVKVNYSLTESEVVFSDNIYIISYLDLIINVAGPDCENVLITLGGDQDYTFNNCNVDSPVLFGSYELNITSPGFTSYQMTIDATTDELNFDIELEAILASPQNLEYITNCNNVDLLWEAPENSEYVNFIGYNVYRNGFIIAENITETTFTDENLQSNGYGYLVKAVYESGESEMSNAVFVEMQYCIPEVSFVGSENSAILTFYPSDCSEVSNLIGLSHMSISRIDNETGDVIVLEQYYTNNIYIDFDIPSGDFSLIVEYWFEDGCNIEIIPIPYPSTIDVNNNKINDLSIFPNPASSYVNIEWGIGMEEIKIFDITGKELGIENANGTSNYQLNTSFLNAGMYYIKILSSNGIQQVKKLIIE